MPILRNTLSLKSKLARIPILLLLPGLGPWACHLFPPKESAATYPVTQIRTAEEFLKNIGSNRELRLKAGKYILTDILYENRMVERHNVFDGFEYVVRNVQNLTISGEKGVELLVRPRYANVLRFAGARNIQIKNLTAGHTDESGACVGGVFVFEDSQQIDMTHTRLFGSGTQGLELSRVRDLRFADGLIEDCTYHTFSIEDSSNILFERSRFTRNREFSQFNLKNSQNIRIMASQIEHNESSDALFDLDSSQLTIANSSIKNNRAQMLVGERNQSRFQQQNNAIADNDFGKRP